MRIQSQADAFALRLAADEYEHISDKVDARPYIPGDDDPDLWLHPDEVLRYRDRGNTTYPEGVEKHKQRIQERGGIRHPISIATDGTRAYVEDGHHRAIAAQQLGMDKVPVKVTPTDFHPDYSSWAAKLKPGPFQDWVRGQPQWGGGQQ